MSMIRSCFLIVALGAVIASSALHGAATFAQPAFRIWDLQVTDYPYTSPHVGETVGTAGVVVAVFGDQDGYVIEAPLTEGDMFDPDRQYGQWNGIFVYSPGRSIPSLGIPVVVTGQVEEADGFTRIVETQRGLAGLPEGPIGPYWVAPDMLSVVDVHAEKFESVWIFTPQVEVTDQLGSQEWMIKEITEDGLADQGAILIYPGDLSVGQQLDCVSGIVWFTGNAFKLRAHPAGLDALCPSKGFISGFPVRPPRERQPASTPTPLPVQHSTVYLPVIMECYQGATPICDGAFEAGRFEPCWDHSGELAQQVEDRLDNGEPAFAGHYSALLGQPGLGSGNDGRIPAGSAWIQQRIHVPNTAQPLLTFQYRVISYDASLGSAGQLWDTFDTTIGGELVFRDDEGEGRPSGSQGSRHDTGWQSAEVDLSPWLGQEVVLHFAVWNREYDGNGVDYYNTWAYLDEVRVDP